MFDVLINVGSSSSNPHIKGRIFKDFVRAFEEQVTKTAKFVTGCAGQRRNIAFQHTFYCRSIGGDDILSEESKDLEVVVAFDYPYDSLGYYMKLPKIIPDTIGRVDVSNANFAFEDGFDYGDAENYCGGYNISGDCPTAGLIFDHWLNVDQNRCVEYWGFIVHRRTGAKLGHEVYYDYHEGYGGGQIDDLSNLTLSEVTNLLKIIANRLIASVGIKRKFERISVLPVTTLVANIESSGMECHRCKSMFHSFRQYYTHKCKKSVELKKLLERVRSASTNKEKKETLTELTKIIIKTVDGFEISYEDKRGLDSEFDLMVINECKQRTLEEMGTPLLVECRNWSVPMPAKAIRDFGGKLRDKNIQTGIIVSMKGVTGSEKTDAKEAIRTFLARDNINMLVFDENDLEKIVEGKKFAELLRRKFYDIRTY